jgi:hypothetical protein
MVGASLEDCSTRSEGTAKKQTTGYDETHLEKSEHTKDTPDGKFECLLTSIRANSRIHSRLSKPM